MKKVDIRVNMFDLPLFSSDGESLLKILETQLLHGEKPAYIFTPNPEQVVQAAYDPTFKHILQQADYLVPDGIGLVLASKLLGITRGKSSLQERIPGVEVVTKLLDLAEKHKLPVMLIGGRDYQIAELPAKNFVWTPGYMNVVSPTPQEEQAIEHLLNEFTPAIVFVAFGAPQQEAWILNHRSILEKNRVRIAMAVGGSFDFLTGRVSRAPKWLQAVGGEWAYRLIRQPWRAGRQMRLLTFMRLTLKELMKGS